MDTNNQEMNTQKDIWTLSANYLSGEMNREERLKFERLIAKNKSISKEFIKIQNSWNSLPEEKPIDSHKAWNNLYSRISHENIAVSEDKKTFSLSWYFARVAAIIILGLIIGIGFKYISKEKTLFAKNINVFEAINSVGSFTLPDGSRVFLNKGSKLSYNKNFINNRNIDLKGEAFFEVMSDPENPFEIKTSGALITVLGTRFNVKETNYEGQTEVFVESGKVKLQSKKESEGILLNKGDFAKSIGNKEKSSKLTDLNYLSWKTHEFRFENQDLVSVFEILKKSYHINIIADIPDIKNQKLSSEYHQQSIDAIIRTICTAFNLQASKKENTYYIEMKK